ncbi:nicotinate-nucleotide--dimethylbenzimidazole phosphoribosyltransferase [Aquimarina sp. 2201CG14-23]|uniref:nicotinate-nucleotide--dimethylbenzimidazole phosphoribosyltransferase n=1 Tax=Aquimarina mycalae TaxID=3040073 RepID=UPI002477EA1B|nr:nicotinate-nucleotide--dimethylbenzimidazole phosphoribosyltransferase [Aquimarina sp. 2201CG14-23]MDH7444091.1 nicotinate-nucleotide--dimethylbenzimidazole phosphoribosyltransferase [Aquimarina sp. 2201CG14-23]
MNFNISPLDKSLENSIQHKINLKTKPVGSLGILERIALQISLIQSTKSPSLEKPTILVFAGDHGIAEKGEVNPYPQAVTQQMVYNFLNGGAAINSFCNQNNIDLKIIDAGVNHNFDNISGLIHAKVAYGTKNYQIEPAMSADQCSTAIHNGAAIVSETYENGSNIIGFGEMGISNSSAAALLMSYFCEIPVKECVGAGTGLQMEAMKLKRTILEEVFKKYAPTSPIEALATFGGFEIAMITGAILKAAELKMTIVIDGFIATAALLVAYALNQNVLDYCIFAHTSNEQGHEKMLRFLGKKPLISLNMRLGEGTGVAVAYPIIQSAVTFLNNMASFEEAEVSTNE